jgi:signal recognition particle subunit SRP54
MSGLQGSGKTTFSENWPISLNKRIKPLLVACDIYRPAAIQQLRCWRFYGVEVYSEPENKNPVEIAQNAIKYAKKRFRYCYC